MKYYPTSGGGTLHETAEQYIPPHGSTYFWTGNTPLNNYFGPAELVRTRGSGQVVAICNEVKTGQAMSYSAFPTTGATNLSLPAQSNWGGWDTWTFIQNPDDYNTATVTVYYYREDGFSRGSYGQTVQPNGSAYVTASSHLHPGERGSARVESSRSVVVIVNQVGGTGDQTMSYNGLLR